MIEELIQLGLTRNEARVYIALLDLGTGAITDISHHSGVERTLVYALVDKLQHKGLVSSVISANKKAFQPAPPKRVIALIQEKMQLANTIIPKLEKKFAGRKNTIEVRHFIGKEGMKSIQERLLEGDEWWIYGATNIPSNLLKTTVEQIHRKRVEKKTLFRAIFTKQSEERAKQVAKQQFTDVRMINLQTTIPVETNISGDIVAQIIWKEQPLGIIIENQDFVQSYKEYFELLWKQSTSVQ